MSQLNEDVGKLANELINVDWKNVIESIEKSFDPEKYSEDFLLRVIDYINEKKYNAKLLMDSKSCKHTCGEDCNIKYVEYVDSYYQTRLDAIRCTCSHKHGSIDGINCCMWTIKIGIKLENDEI